MAYRQEHVFEKNAIEVSPIQYYQYLSMNSINIGIFQ